MKKKILSIFLSVVMVAGLFSTTALAHEDQNSGWNLLNKYCKQAGDIFGQNFGGEFGCGHEDNCGHIPSGFPSEEDQQFFNKGNHGSHEGFDKQGFDKQDFDKQGFGDQGFGGQGFDKYGKNEENIEEKVLEGLGNAFSTMYGESKSADGNDKGFFERVGDILEGKEAEQDPCEVAWNLLAYNWGSGYAPEWVTNWDERIKSSDCWYKDDAKRDCCDKDYECPISEPAWVCECDVEATECVYTGLEQFPEKVVVSLDGEELVQGLDYELWFSSDEDHINVGEYSIMVHGTWPYGKLMGYGEYSYNIVPRDINDPEIEKEITADLFYNGEAQEPEIVLVNTFTGDPLVEGVDYTVEYEDNVEPGTAKAIIKGIGNFTGELELEYKIQANSYKFTSGDGQKVDASKAKDVEFTTNGNVAFFEGLEVDGKKVEDKYYKVSGDETSTKIVLKADFIDTLKNGNHTIKAIYHDASCTAKFNVTGNSGNGSNSAKTGDSNTMIIWFVVLAAAIGAGAYAAIRRRRYF